MKAFKKFLASVLSLCLFHSSVLPAWANIKPGSFRGGRPLNGSPAFQTPSPGPDALRIQAFESFLKIPNLTIEKLRVLSDLSPKTPWQSALKSAAQESLKDLDRRGKDGSSGRTAEGFEGQARILESMAQRVKKEKAPEDLSRFYDGSVLSSQQGAGEVSARSGNREKASGGSFSDGLASRSGQFFGEKGPREPKRISFPAVTWADYSFITGFSFSPDGEKLAVAHLNGTVDLLDPKTGNILDSFHLGVAGVEGISWSEDGKSLLAVYGRHSPGLDTGTILWNLKERKGERVFSESSGREVEDILTAKGYLKEPSRGVFVSASMSPDKSKFAALNNNGALLLWDVYKKKKTWLMPFWARAANIEIRGFEVGGGLILLGLGGAVPWIIDRIGGLPSFEWRMAEGLLMIFNAFVFSSAITLALSFKTDSASQKFDLWRKGVLLVSFAWSLDSRELIGLTKTGRIVVWDARTGKKLRETPLKSAVLDGGRKSVLSASFSQGGGKVMAGLEGGGAALFDSSTGEKLHFFKGLKGEGPVDRTAISPDGSKAAAASAALGRSIHFWSSADGAESSLSVPEGGPSIFSFSADGSGLAAKPKEKDELYLWNLNYTPEELAAMEKELSQEVEKPKDDPKKDGDSSGRDPYGIRWDAGLKALALAFGTAALLPGVSYAADVFGPALGLWPSLTSFGLAGLFLTLVASLTFLDMQINLGIKKANAVNLLERQLKPGTGSIETVSSAGPRDRGFFDRYKPVKIFSGSAAFPVWVSPDASRAVEIDSGNNAASVLNVLTGKKTVFPIRLDLLSFMGRVFKGFLPFSAIASALPSRDGRKLAFLTNEGWLFVQDENVGGVLGNVRLLALPHVKRRVFLKLSILALALGSSSLGVIFLGLWVIPFAVVMVVFNARGNVRGFLNALPFPRDRILAFAWNPSGDGVIGVSEDGTLFQWDEKGRGREKGKLWNDGQRKPILAVFSEEAGKLLVLIRDRDPSVKEKILKVYDVASGGSYYQSDLDSRKFVNSAAVSQDGLKIALAEVERIGPGPAQRITVKDIPSGAESYSAPVGAAPIHYMTFGQDKTELLALNGDGEAIAWDTRRSQEHLAAMEKELSREVEKPKEEPKKDGASSARDPYGIRWETALKVLALAFGLSMLAPGISYAADVLGPASGLGASLASLGWASALGGAAAAAGRFHASFFPDSGKKMKEIKSRAGGGETIEAAALSPDGKRLAVAYADGTHAWSRSDFLRYTIVYDLETGSVLNHIPAGISGVAQLLWAPDGKGLVEIDESGENVWTFDLEKNSSRSLSDRIGSSLGSLALSPDHSRLAGWKEEGGSIQILNAKSGRKLSTVKVRPFLTFHSWRLFEKLHRILNEKWWSALPFFSLVVLWSAVLLAAYVFNPSGATVLWLMLGSLSFCCHGLVNAPKLVNRLHKAVLQRMGGLPLRDIVWSADGTQVITVSTKGQVSYWDSRSGKKIKTVQLIIGRDSDIVSFFKFSRDGSTIAATLQDEIFAIFDALTGSIKSLGKGLTLFSLNPDGSKLAMRLGEDIAVQDLSDGEIKLREKAGSINSLDFDSSGRNLVVVAGNAGEQAARIYRLGYSPEELAEMEKQLSRNAEKPKDDPKKGGDAPGPDPYGIRWDSSLGSSE